jgi:hypothetical protein
MTCTPFKTVGGKDDMVYIHDSGERQEFDTGAVRDIEDGKGDLVSLPPEALLRISVHYEHGAKKYDRFNYMKGIPVTRFINSALRHILKYLMGCDQEDHLSAAAFNILGAIQMEETLPDMCDMPTREGKNTFKYNVEA